MILSHIDDFFDRYQHLAVLFIRITFGIHLLYYSWDPVLSLTAGDGAEWLGSMGVPLPLLMSWAYVLTQFLGGFMLILGYRTRLISIPLLIVFLVAYFLVHFSDPYADAYPALQMIAISLFFLFYGSGSISLDDFLKNRR